MDFYARKFFFYLGIIAAIYITIAHILPFIFELVGALLKILLIGAFWIVIIAAVIFVIAHIIQRSKNYY